MKNMYIRVSKSEFKSSNQRNKVHVKGYRLDEKNLLGIVIVLHGMSECKEIYTELAEYLAMRDYGVITYDHIGHGDSINNKDEQGFFANENGYQYLIQDLAFLVNEAKKFQLPIFLVGHSMGALIARAYMAQKKNKYITGLVSCGTIGPQWAIDGAIQFAEYMIDKKGPRYRSRKLNQLVTKVSTWKFEKVEYPLEWITRDKEFIRKVKDDEKMNFIFTASGLKDVFILTKLVGQKETIEKMPKDLPILLLSGKDDILGEYGEGVNHLVEAYRKAGMQEVMVKIYKDARHNLLQELNRKEVEKDIYDWIEAVRVAAMDGKGKNEKEETEK